jgi:hypothetical protein
MVGAINALAAIPAVACDLTDALMTTLLLALNRNTILDAS